MFTITYKNKDNTLEYHHQTYVAYIEQHQDIRINVPESYFSNNGIPLSIFHDSDQMIGYLAYEKCIPSMGEDDLRLIYEKFPDARSLLMHAAVIDFTQQHIAHIIATVKSILLTAGKIKHDHPDVEYTNHFDVCLDIPVDDVHSHVMQFILDNWPDDDRCRIYFGKAVPVTE